MQGNTHVEKTRRTRRRLNRAEYEERIGKYKDKGKAKERRRPRYEDEVDTDGEA